MNWEWNRLLWGEMSIRRLIISTIFVYFVLAVFAYFYSDRLIFQPQPSSYRDTKDILKLTTADGTKISALFLPNSRATYTILYSHGNAEDLGDIRPILTEIRAIGFAVFAYDYRGYGTSEGTPSEPASYQDIDAAYAYVTQKIGTSPERVLLLGRSVGSGPSVDLATRKPIGGLILESPFTSTFVVLTRIPLFPFDKFHNLGKIQQVRRPILIIHGTNDQVIPLSHGQALFRAANEPKQSFWVDGADHNDVMLVAGNQYAEALNQFTQLVQQHSQLTSGKNDRP
jgi:abhydrolase domain-containing protein 17